MGQLLRLNTMPILSENHFLYSFFLAIFGVKLAFETNKTIIYPRLSQLGIKKRDRGLKRAIIKWNYHGLSLFIKYNYFANICDFVLFSFDMFQFSEKYDFNREKGVVFSLMNTKWVANAKKRNFSFNHSRDVRSKKVCILSKKKM